MKLERSKPKTYEQLKKSAKATKEEVLGSDHVVTAIENGPGSTHRQFGRTLDGVLLETIVAVYTEMIGQTARANRNVEQAAPEIAKKAILCANELIKAISAAAADSAADRPAA